MREQIRKNIIQFLKNTHFLVNCVRDIDEHVDDVLKHDGCPCTVKGQPGYRPYCPCKEAISELKGIHGSCKCSFFISESCSWKSPSDIDKSKHKTADLLLEGKSAKRGSSI